jgi:hypothetical protein
MKIKAITVVKRRSKLAKKVLRKIKKGTTFKEAMKMKKSMSKKTKRKKFDVKKLIKDFGEKRMKPLKEPRRKIILKKKVKKSPTILKQRSTFFNK